MPTFKQLFTLFTFAVLLSCASANAQEHNFVMSVNVPFRFTLGDKKFSAGAYEVIGQAPNLLHLRDTKGRLLLSAITHDIDGDKPPMSKLSFHRQGKDYVLSQVWLVGNTTGREIERVVSPVAISEPTRTSPASTLFWSQDTRNRGRQ